jgi:hypothetical protein
METLSGADLSIPEDASAVLRDGSKSTPSVIARIGLYTSGGLAILWAVIDRRRRSRDPEAVRRQRELKRCRALLECGSNVTPIDAAQAIVTSLRGVLSQSVEHGRRSEVEQLIARCETLIYAPAGAAVSIPHEMLLREAKALVDGILGERG